MIAVGTVWIWIIVLLFQTVHCPAFSTAPAFLASTTSNNCKNLSKFRCLVRVPMSPRDEEIPSESEADEKLVTIIGFGSLLSERSSRLTFPNLQRFRLGRVPGYRRVFGHPASIFFQRGIANLDTLEISSLSVEFVSEEYPGFVASLFEVPNENNEMLQRPSFSGGSIVPSQSFLEREEEFNIVPATYQEWDDGTRVEMGGIICQRSTDEEYLKRWGDKHFETQYEQYGIKTIWGWSRDSGMRPCAVYLRHCYLAAKGLGPECLQSFLDDTFLIDRKTTLREYVDQNPEVLETLPPPELAERYCG